MAGGKGHKATCPGLPTIAHGFSNNYKWYHCYGEVFKIYARGKRNGAVIRDHESMISHCVIFVLESGWDFLTLQTSGHAQEPNFLHLQTDTTCAGVNS